MRATLNPINESTGVKIDAILEACDISALDLLLWTAKRGSYSLDAMQVCQMALRRLCMEAGAEWLADHFYCGYDVDKFVIICTIKREAVMKRLIRVSESCRGKAWQYLVDNFGGSVHD